MQANKPPADQLGIADGSRARPGNASTAETRCAAELDARRVDEIRSRILAGAYQTNEMAEQVARAILRSGDL